MLHRSDIITVEVFAVRGLGWVKGAYSRGRIESKSKLKLKLKLAQGSLARGRAKMTRYKRLSTPYKITTRNTIHDTRYTRHLYFGAYLIRYWVSHQLT
jgi:hypothetical protein